MSRTTPATQALDRAGVDYTLATYDYDPTADRIGMQAARALGAAASEVLKTLIVKADGKPACVVLPATSVDNRATRSRLIALRSSCTLSTIARSSLNSGCCAARWRARPA